MKKGFNLNRVMLADSYKYTHTKQYEPGTKGMYDYAEARSTNVYDKTLFVGLQYLLKLFDTPITKEEVQEAEMYAVFHGISFNKTGWDIIVNEYNGKLPIIVKSINEGSFVPNKIVLYTIEASIEDSRVFWIVSWLETVLMKVWYPCNIGTRSFYTKKMLTEMGKLTDENPFVSYQLHGFGDRASSSIESASWGNIGHLSCFLGTDNFHSLKTIKETYNIKDEDIGKIAHSIDASEHSTVTSWGKDKEQDFVMNFLEVSKGRPMIACVGDSYDIYNFTDFVTKGEFKEKIESDEYPIFVIRPDSGVATEVIDGMLDIMERNKVSFTTNSKGYKVFNKMRIIYGDGINMETMRDMLSLLILRGYSTQNIAFGMGSELMHNHNRDTLGFAIKCSEVTKVDGTRIDVFKDPITAPNKKSKKGRVTTYFNKETGEYFVDLINKYKTDITIEDALQLVFKDGILYNQTDIFIIRDRVDACLNNELEA